MSVLNPATKVKKSLVSVYRALPPYATYSEGVSRGSTARAHVKLVSTRFSHPVLDSRCLLCSCAVSGEGLYKHVVFAWREPGELGGLNP